LSWRTVQDAALKGSLRRPTAALDRRFSRAGIEYCTTALLRCGYTVIMEKEASFVTVQARGVIAIPPALRRQFGLDRPGAQVEVLERDGEIVLRPHVPVPSDQAWFWTERWQKMEREADDDVAVEKVASFENVDDFLADLDS
jgi:AbrB family looped-hinge helix DNA binding protein